MRVVGPGEDTVATRQDELFSRFAPPQGAPLILAPLSAALGDRGFFVLVAGILIAVSAAALVSQRRMRV